jgi:hypothetical protein
VFDGSRTGRYEESYYRFLNIGLRMPISTGTDWFIYDFSRVYAKVGDTVTAKNWLAAVKAGRCIATNGPLLTLTVDKQEFGDTIQIDQPKAVRIEARGIGRHDFQKLELVQNGKVIQSQLAAKKDGRYVAELKHEVKVDAPAWFAVRIDAQTRDEFGRQLFAHSSPIYVDVAGKRFFDLEAARDLLRQVEEAQAEIRARGRFSSVQARDRVLALYEQAARELRRRMAERSSG